MSGKPKKRLTGKSTPSRSRDAGKPHVKMWVLWAPTESVKKAVPVNYIDNYSTTAARNRHVRRYQKWGAELVGLGLVWQWRIYDGETQIAAWSNYDKQEAAAAAPAQA
jgi:hypothetical protein